MSSSKSPRYSSPIERACAWKSLRVPASSKTIARSGAIDAGSFRNSSRACGSLATCISRANFGARRWLCRSREGLAMFDPPRGPGRGTTGVGSGSLRRGRSGIVLFCCHSRSTYARSPNLQLLLGNLGGRTLAEREHLAPGEIQKKLLCFPETDRAELFRHLLSRDAKLDSCAFAQLADEQGNLFLRRRWQWQA